MGIPFCDGESTFSKVIVDDFWWSTWINLPIFDAQLKGPISRWSLHFCRASPRFSGGIYMFLGEIAYFLIFWLNLQCFMVKSQFFGCLNQCLCISCRLNQSNFLKFRFEFLQVTSPFLMILSPFFSNIISLNPIISPFFVWVNLRIFPMLSAFFFHFLVMKIDLWMVRWY